MTDQQTYFMLLKTTATWLALKPDSRFEYLESIIQPILKKHAAVTLQYFDSEFFSARITDIAMWQTDDQKAWAHLVEDLRCELFWGTYFEIVELIPAIKNAYSSNYQRPAI